MISAKVRFNNLKFKSDSAKLTNNVINQAFDDSTIRRIQTELVDGIVKPQIAVGQSPVRGWGRFDNYKNPDKYPGKKKSKRPVNLNLTDTMMSYYTAWRSGVGVKIGLSGASKRVRDYAKANNEGTENIPARRFIPLTKQSEQFSVTFMSKFKKILSERIAKLINQG